MTAWNADQVYAFADAELRSSFAGCAGLTESICAAPLFIDATAYQMRADRAVVFQRFFDTAKQVFARCVSGQVSDSLSRLLLSDSQEFLPPNFFERLPREAWTSPRFFRTDEGHCGTVFEIQCPGSGWGDLPLLRSLYLAMGLVESESIADAMASVVADITSICGEPRAAVLHLLDNASNPVSMRYLFSKTQPPLRYWGYDPGVTHEDIRLVRSHSVFGLVSENLFWTRLRECAEGKLWFDLPPLIVFDQKMLLCLPFLDETSAEFDDAIRATLAYSTPLLANGFRDVDGSWVTIDDFLKRGTSERRYFLKYGGSDTNHNWGSRAIYRLDSNKANARECLEKAVADAERRRFWIIQPEARQEKNDVACFSREKGYCKLKGLTPKYSSFYGPSGLAGLRTTHRRHFKVHGQPDSVIGLALPRRG